MQVPSQYDCSNVKETLNPSTNKQTVHIQILTELSAILWPSMRYSFLRMFSSEFGRNRLTRPTWLRPPPPMGTHPPLESSRVITCACTRTSVSSLKQQQQQFRHVLNTFNPLQPRIQNGCHEYWQYFFKKV